MRKKSKLSQVPRQIEQLFRRAASEPWLLEFGPHALEGMARDNLDVDDLIYAVLHAYSVEREPDENSWAPWKYIICGELADGFRVYTVGKLLRDEDAKEVYWFVTAHAAA